LSEVDRRELARLCAEHDRMMAEASEPIRSPPARKTDDALVYKTTWSEPAPAATADTMPSDADEADPPLGRAEAIEALGELIVELRREWRAERDQAIAPLKAEIARLEGKIEALLAIVGKGEVVDLPRGFWRRDRDVA
jgi:hypothetical protein